MLSQESIDNLRKVVRQSYEDEIAYLRAENAALRAALQKSFATTATVVSE